MKKVFALIVFVNDLICCVVLCSVLFCSVLYDNCAHIKTKPLVSTNQTLTRHV